MDYLYSFKIIVIIAYPLFSCFIIQVFLAGRSIFIAVFDLSKDLNARIEAIDQSNQVLLLVTLIMLLITLRLVSCVVLKH